MKDYSAHLADAPRRLDALNNALNSRDMATAWAITRDLQRRLDGVMSWILAQDVTPRPKPAHPFVVDAEVTD